jgi:hypothetical protein
MLKKRGHLVVLKSLKDKKLKLEGGILILQASDRLLTFINAKEIIFTSLILNFYHDFFLHDLTFHKNFIITMNFHFLSKKLRKKVIFFQIKRASKTTSFSLFFLSTSTSYLN